MGELGVDLRARIDRAASTGVEPRRRPARCRRGLGGRSGAMPQPVDHVMLDPPRSCHVLLAATQRVDVDGEHLDRHRVEAAVPGGITPPRPVSIVFDDVGACRRRARSRRSGSVRQARGCPCRRRRDRRRSCRRRSWSPRSAAAASVALPESEQHVVGDISDLGRLEDAVEAEARHRPCVRLVVAGADAVA